MAASRSLSQGLSRSLGAPLSGAVAGDGAPAGWQALKLMDGRVVRLMSGQIIYIRKTL